MKLGENWQSQLAMLDQGWNGYDAKPITSAAILAVEAVSVTPCNDGGIQLELHRDGFDIEICFDPAGKVESAIIGVAKL